MGGNATVAGGSGAHTALLQQGGLSHNHPIVVEQPWQKTTVVLCTAGSCPQSSPSLTTPLLPTGWHLLHAQVLPGLQSLPLLRLPLMLTPDPVRHWSYEGALIDFRLARHAGAPGDLEGGTLHPGASSSHCHAGSHKQP